MKSEISVCKCLMLNDHSNPYKIIEITTILSDTADGHHDKISFYTLSPTHTEWERHRTDSRLHSTAAFASSFEWSRRSIYNTSIL